MKIEKVMDCFAITFLVATLGTFSMDQKDGINHHKRYEPAWEKQTVKKDSPSNW